MNAPDKEEARRDRLGADLPGRLPEVLGDRESLLRVFANVIGNAIKYTPQKGSISVSAVCDAHYVTVRIADTGPGIPARAREKLFQPFQGSTRRGGTGLGLPISAELAHLHGGSLKLLDTATGAAFELRIPDRASMSSS